MALPWSGQLYTHPAISIPLEVFVSYNVEVIRDRPDLEIKKGDIMQIHMAPNGFVSLGTFKGGNGTCYAEVADAKGNITDAQEGVDFRII